MRIGVTYMTGALVKAGKGLAAALFREEPFLWAPHPLLWFGLVLGGVLGASAYSRWGAAALCWPTTAFTLLAALSFKVFPRRQASAR